jgi:hypothetical protein
VERRRACRRRPSTDEPASLARLRTGRDMAVLDVSDAGILVEGVTRLLPGTHVDVHVVAHDGRTLVRCRVARCFIAALDAGSVTYRGALAFERHVDTRVPGYLVPAERVGTIGEMGTHYPLSMAPTEPPIEQRLSA